MSAPVDVSDMERPLRDRPEASESMEVPPAPARMQSDVKEESCSEKVQQQKLPAVFIKSSPAQMAGCCGVCAAIWFFTALALMFTPVAEFKYDYTDVGTDGNGVSKIKFKLEAEMKPPIYLSYQLDNFFQNHRTYVNSISTGQYSGGNPDGAGDGITITSGCDHFAKDETGLPLFPCGLIANSLFNDSFALAANGDTWVNISTEPAHIAWPADLNGKYANTVPTRKLSTDKLAEQSANMWIVNEFPPQDCVQTTLGDKINMDWRPVDVAMRDVTDVNGKTQKIADCEDWTSDTASCKWMRDGEPFECGGDYKPVRRAGWGVESGHLMNWLRVAALPGFRKTWGRIDVALPANQEHTLYIRNRFPATESKARKTIVLGNVNLTGASGSEVGVMSMVNGFLCLAFSVLILVSRTKFPSKDKPGPSTIEMS